MVNQVVEKDRERSSSLVRAVARVEVSSRDSRFGITETNLVVAHERERMPGQPAII